ncbi:response regulator [Bradyrhizobium sp. LM2.3]
MISPIVSQCENSYCCWATLSKRFRHRPIFWHRVPCLKPPAWSPTLTCPGMTGIELHRHLVDTGYAIPTILVTAYPDEVVRDQALKDGVVCYLSKPVDDDYLERCLRSALQPGTPIGDNS